jgi:hypothetical protein
LRAENSQKSDNLANVITTGLERNASELASDRAILQENQSFLRETGVTQVDDKVDDLTTATTTGNTEQKSYLQRIAANVDPNLQGSRDREEQNETLLNRKKQLDFFGKMSKSLANMVVKPIRATAGSISTFMKSLAVGGAIIGLLAFLDSDMWKEWQKWIVDELPKKLIAIKEGFVDKEGNVTFLNGLKTLAVQLGLWDDGIQGLNDTLENIGIAATILAIGVGLTKFGLAWKGIKWALTKAGIIAPAVVAGGAAATVAGSTAAAKPQPMRGTLPPTGGSPNPRQVVQNTAGKWTIASASGAPTEKMVPKAEISNIKSAVAVTGRGGSGGAKSNIPILVKGARAVLSKVPFLSYLLGGIDLVDIVKNPKLNMGDKTAAIAEVVGRMGFSVLGSIAGAMIGAPFGLGLFSPITSAIGSTAGLFLGYNYGPETATAFAQWVLGQKITAYDGVKDAWEGIIDEMFRTARLFIRLTNAASKHFINDALPSIFNSIIGSDLLA